MRTYGDIVVAQQAVVLGKPPGSSVVVLSVHGEDADVFLELVYFHDKKVTKRRTCLCRQRTTEKTSILQVRLWQ